MCDGSGFGTSSTSGEASDKIIVASSLLSAFGNLREGKQGQQFYNYKAGQAEADAAAERGLGVVRAGKIRKAGRLAQGQVQAAYGGSGIDVNTGTPLVTAEVLERNISEDATAQLLTGERKARALTIQAGADRVAGENVRSSSYLAAGRSVLGGVAASMDAKSNRDRWIRKAQTDQTAYERSSGTGAFSYNQEFTP